MESFDYVVVGAGAAGCVLAYRLSEKPQIRVCLIEAGPRDSHPFIAISQKPLAELVGGETSPGLENQSDNQILEAYDRFGTCAYHAVGSCRMGKYPLSVVDTELRVRGVEALRVMDTSIMPSIPAGNTQGPTMAMGWRAADIILRGRPSATS